MVDKREILREWLQERTIEDGLIEVYKPYGVPSTALTEIYKRVTGEKVGHGGTLDPLAEGMMMLGIGKGTKLLTKHLASEKRYRATMLFGAQSFSGDLELPIEIPERTERIDASKIPEILVELAKGYTQELPLLSAVKHNGKTSYQLVREGKFAEVKTAETKLLDYVVHECRSITSKDAEKLLKEVSARLEKSFGNFQQIGLSVQYNAEKYGFMISKWQTNITNSVELAKSTNIHNYLVLELEVLVPKGMYIRSLVNDIASRFGTVGVLVRLVRRSYS